MGVAAEYRIDDTSPDAWVTGRPASVHERVRADARQAACLRLAATAIKAAWIEAASEAGRVSGAASLEAVREAWVDSRAAEEHRTLLEMADHLESANRQEARAR